jgi:hypothetical protein
MPKLDKQDQRIANIFGTKDVPDVTDETLEMYLDYLKQNLEMPCLVTGIEDMGCFAWEEYIRDLSSTRIATKEPGYEKDHH